MNDDTPNDKKRGGGFREPEDIKMIAYDSPRGAALNDSSPVVNEIGVENDQGLLPPIASAASKKTKNSNKTTVIDQKQQPCEDDKLAAAIFMTSRSC